MFGLAGTLLALAIVGIICRRQIQNFHIGIFIAISDKLIDHELIDFRIAPAELITHPCAADQSEKFGPFSENSAVVNGDIMIAEQGARIGFAGRRVIEQTIRQKLPVDFQTAEYLMKHGQLDMIVKRNELKETLAKILKLHRH